MRKLQEHYQRCNQASKSLLERKWIKCGMEVMLRTLAAMISSGRQFHIQVPIHISSVYHLCRNFLLLLVHVHTIIMGLCYSITRLRTRPQQWYLFFGKECIKHWKLSAITINKITGSKLLVLCTGFILVKFWALSSWVLFLLHRASSGAIQHKVEWSV